MCSCQAAVSLLFWGWRAAMLLFLLYVVVADPELEQGTASFIMTVAYGTELVWALALCGALYPCAPGVLLTFTRYVLKLVILAWLVAAPIVYAYEKCLGSKPMQVYWLA
jgi:hypothetical protein